MEELFKYASFHQEYLLNVITENLEAKRSDLALEFIKRRRKELEKAGIGVNKAKGYDFYIITKGVKEISGATMVIVIDSDIQISNSTMVLCCKYSNIIAENCSSLVSYDNCSIKANECTRILAHDDSKITACNARNITLRNRAIGKFIGDSRGVAYDNSIINCYNTSECVLYNDTKGYFYHSSKGDCYNESVAYAYMNSKVKLHERASGFIFDDVKAKCYDSSYIEIRGVKEAIINSGTRAIVADRTFTDNREGCLIAESCSVVYSKGNPICDTILKHGAIHINTETGEAYVCE